MPRVQQHILLQPDAPEYQGLKRDEGGDIMQPSMATELQTATSFAAKNSERTKLALTRVVITVVE